MDEDWQITRITREHKDKAAVGERANSSGPAAPDNERKPDHQ